MAPKEDVPVVADENDDSYADKNVAKEFVFLPPCSPPYMGVWHRLLILCLRNSNDGPRGKTSNPNYNVGGTA